jgi:hypothetical protein
MHRPVWVLTAFIALLMGLAGLGLVGLVLGGLLLHRK